MNVLIRSTSSALTRITTEVVHPTYFPFLWAPTLHAARISIVFQTVMRKTNSRMGWGPYIAGYLISCWAGGIITNFMLGLPPPMAYSVQPWINYIAVHLALTAFFDVFPWLLVSKQIDTVFLPIDALLRATSVCGTVSLLHSPAIPLQFKAMDTPFGHAILGALASSSGGIAMGTFGLASGQWAMSTPPVLSSGLWGGSVDVWGGALAALIYSAAIHDPAFAFTSLSPSKLPFPLNLVPSSILHLFFVRSNKNFGSSTRYLPLTSSPVPHLEGKAWATLAFGVLFGVRVIRSHWLTPTPAKQVVGTKGRPGNVAKGSRLVSGSPNAKTNAK